MSVVAAVVLAWLGWVCRSWWPWEAVAVAWTPAVLLVVGLFIRGAMRRAEWQPRFPAPAQPGPDTPPREPAVVDAPAAAVVDLAVERERRRAA